MKKLEKVETVVQKTGVTYEEARDALEQNDYDVLDAIVWLEQQGKSQTNTAHHSTDAAEKPMSTDMARAQQAYQESSKKSQFSDMFERLMECLKRLCSRGLEVTFVVDREDSQLLAIPVLILVVLILFLFPATVPLLIVGLFFGFRYHFDGLDNGSVNVNEAMGKVADQAEGFRRDVMGK